MKIYFQPQTKNYYGVDLICSHCGKEIIGEMALLHYCWFDRRKSKHPSKSEILCVKCTPKKIRHYEVEESYMIICIPRDKMPTGLIEWVHYKCELSDGKAMNTFEAAYLSTEKTIDKTKHAGRDTFFNAIAADGGENVRIGKSEGEVMKEDIERLQQIEDDPAKFLIDMQNAKPIVPEGNKLEHKSGDEDETTRKNR